MENTNTNLSDCVYEHIEGTFYHGLFGDFKIVIDSKTGCFNATKMCNAAHNKHFRQWKVLERSKRLFEYYSEKHGQNFETNFLYEVRLQNNHTLNKQVTGIYVPKEFMLDVASWISTEFYDKCNTVIINYFINQFKRMDKDTFKNKIKNAEERMAHLTLQHREIVKGKDDRIDQLDMSLDEVKNQNKKFADDMQMVQIKLGIAVRDRAPFPEDKSKAERFVLLQRNDRDHYPYYVIRAQDDYVDRKLKLEREHFPNLKVLIDFKCSPNSKTLYTRIKENLKVKNVVFQGNNIDIGNLVTEQELVEQMTSVNDSRVDLD